MRKPIPKEPRKEVCVSMAPPFVQSWVQLSDESMGGRLHIPICWKNPRDSLLVFVRIQLIRIRRFDKGRVMSAQKTPTVPALERGIAILELVAKSRHGLTFSQVARAFQYPQSSIHCLLVTLERLGYLQRLES